MKSQDNSLAQSKIRPFQWKRKILHVFNGSLGLWFYIYSGLSEIHVLMILASCAFMSFVFDFARMKSPVVNQFAFKYFSGAIREEEKNSYTSMTKGLGVTLLILLVFPRPVNILVMLYSTYGDAAGAIVGSHWGKLRLNSHASLEGSFAVWIVSSLAVYCALRWILMPIHLDLWAICSVVFFSGGIATIAEGAFPRYDDNMIIPIFSALPTWLLLKSYGII